MFVESQGRLFVIYFSNYNSNVLGLSPVVLSDAIPDDAVR